MSLDIDNETRKIYTRRLNKESSSKFPEFYTARCTSEKKPDGKSSKIF